MRPTVTTDRTPPDTNEPAALPCVPSPLCFAAGPVCLCAMHADLSREHHRFLDQFDHCALGNHAFLVALLVVPLLYFCELCRIWPRSPNRRIPAFRLARHFHLPDYCTACSARATGGGSPCKDSTS